MMGGTLDYPAICSCCPQVDEEFGDAGHDSYPDPGAEDLVND